MKSTRTWFLIADGARARVVVNDGPGRGVREALDREFAAPNPPTHIQGTERPGRGVVPASARRHGMQPRSDLHELTKQRFVADLAGMLEKASDRDDFDRLVLVAPPRILGNLRQVINGGVRERVRAELAKDLTRIPVHRLAGHLQEVLPL